MTQDIGIVPIEDRERWVAEHRNGGLPSQSWSYARGLSASGITPRLAVIRSAGARMLLPFYEREWMGRTDIATIYGASGASIVPASATPLSLWREFAIGKGWVAGYIQLSGNEDFADCPYDRDCVINKTIFLLDLSAPDVLGAASRTVRRKIDKAIKSGTVLVDEPSALVQSMKCLYPATMRSLGASAHFRFAPETLERWVLDSESLVLGASVGGVVEAVYLFRVAGGRAEAHVAGRSETGQGLLPWLIWHGIKRLQQRGVRVLNLGGGLREGDGLHRFKQWFHGMPRIRRSICQVYDQAAYDDLCSRTGVARTEEWFPAYTAGRPDV